MAKITLIKKQMGQQILPITINQDGSINAAVSFGFIETIDMPDNTQQTNFEVQSQNTYYLTAAEAETVHSTVAEKNEMLADLLERAVADVLRTKGVLQA